MKDYLHDIIDDYAQKVVDDMNMGELMGYVKQSTIDWLEAIEEPVVINEIKDSVYSDEVLQDYAKQSTIDWLEAIEEPVVINEIKDSVYSDEILQDYVPTIK